MNPTQRILVLCCLFSLVLLGQAVGQSGVSSSNNICQYLSVADAERVTGIDILRQEVAKDGNCNFIVWVKKSRQSLRSHEEIFIRLGFFPELQHPRDVEAAKKSLQKERKQALAKGGTDVGELIVDVPHVGDRAFYHQSPLGALIWTHQGKGFSLTLESGLLTLDQPELAMLAKIVNIKGQNCLSYEPSRVELSGKMKRVVFPGPPEYEDVAKGDRPEVRWVLYLAKTICVDEDKKQELPLVDDTGEVGLLLEPEQYKGYKKFLNQQVIISGSLFTVPESPHYHTEVSLKVAKIRKK